MFFDLNRAHPKSQQSLEHQYAATANAHSTADTSIPLGDIVRMAGALTKTGMKRTSFLNLQDPKSPYFDPAFPKRIRLGARSVGWSENELEVWLLMRKNSSTGGVQ